MQCLENYIGLRGLCNSTAPESGLYINDLPGISLKVLDKISNEEQVTFFETWKTIQRRTLQRLNTAVVNAMQKKYRLNKLVEYNQLPATYDATNNQTAAAAEYRGLTIDITGWDERVSALMVIHVQTLRLYLKAAGDVTIKFYSLNGTAATEVKSITISGVIGWNSIPVNEYFYDVAKLFIGYDATAVSSVELKLDETLNADYCCDGCWDGWDCCGSQIKGAKSDKPFSTLTQGNNTFGLTGVVSIQCRYENLVCNNKSLFATALWYLLGAECMAERVHSDRINRYTTVAIDKAKELRNEYTEAANVELAQVVDGITLNLSDCCLECNASVTSVEMRP
jgi:hypothetical protein